MGTTFAKISTLALALVVAGCTTANPVVVEQHRAAVKLQFQEARESAQRAVAYKNSLQGSPVDTLYADHRISPELHAQQVQVSQHAAGWINTDPRTRITSTGPDLGAYGNSYGDVSMCKVDVALAVQDSETAKRFKKQCYDLLPVKHRAQLYQLDQVEIVPVERVDIFIQVQPPLSNQQGQRPAFQSW